MSSNLGARTSLPATTTSSTSVVVDFQGTRVIETHHKQEKRCIKLIEKVCLVVPLSVKPYGSLSVLSTRVGQS
jgi:hypothetical protein